MSDRVVKVLAELLNDLYDVTEPVIDQMLKKAFNIKISIFFKDNKNELFEDSKRAINASILEALLYDHLMKIGAKEESFVEAYRFFDLIADSNPLVEGLHTLMNDRLEAIQEKGSKEDTVYECMYEAIELMISRLTVLEADKGNEDILKEYLKNLEICKPAISYKVRELNW